MFLMESVVFRLQNGRQIVLGDGEPFKLESQTMIVSSKQS